MKLPILRLANAIPNYIARCKQVLPELKKCSTYNKIIAAPNDACPSRPWPKERQPAGSSPGPDDVALDGFNRCQNRDEERSAATDGASTAAYSESVAPSYMASRAGHVRAGLHACRQQRGREETRHHTRCQVANNTTSRKTMEENFFLCHFVCQFFVASTGSFLLLGHVNK